MECGQVKTIAEIIAAALVKDAEGNVYLNAQLLPTECLEAFIDCENNHIPTDDLLVNIFTEDDCGNQTLKIAIAPLTSDDLPEITLSDLPDIALNDLSDVSGTPTINGQFYSWDVANGRFELRDEWDDLPPVPVVNARLGSTAPTLAAFIGTIEQYTFDATNDYIIGSTEIIHGWKEGSAILPHIHWATNGLEAAAKGVQWQLKYTVSDHDEVFIAEQTVVIDATIPVNTPDRTHFISSFAPTIDGTNLKIGAYIIWRLQRIATAHAGGAPLADPFGIAVGFHTLFNSRGSETYTTK